MTNHEVKVAFAAIKQSLSRPVTLEIKNEGDNETWGYYGVVKIPWPHGPLHKYLEFRNGAEAGDIIRTIMSMELLQSIQQSVYQVTRPMEV